MTELLTLYICANGLNGCPQVQQAYLYQHPEIDQTMQRVTSELPKFARDVGPLIAMIKDKEVNIPLDKEYTLVLQQNTTLLKINIGFK